MAIAPFIKKLREKIGHDLLILPSVCGIVVNEWGDVLLQESKDTGTWMTIGGVADPGEEPGDAVVREVFEETGVTVIPERITSVTNSPIVTYPNGDQVQYVIVTFRCRPIAGEPHVHDDESLEIRYLDPNALPPMRPDQLVRLRHALGTASTTFFQPPRLRDSPR
jgi:8-oxo-dGTP pyrophosphatase MutT (NUDIX family)